MDSIAYEPAAMETPAPVSGLAYDGRLGDLYRIFLRNLLLTVLTLGFFRFWAVTRTRRYMWSHMSFQGDRFEYAGTGAEKLRGFLIVALIVGVLWGPNTAVGLSAASGLRAVRIATAVVYGGTLFLLGQMAPFTAQRYRLSRTLWRGIGGGMVGSPARYGMFSLLCTIGSMATLFMLSPWRRMRLARRRIDSSSFGGVRLRMLRAEGFAFGAFLGATALKLFPFLAVVVGLAFMLAAMDRAGHHLDPKTFERIGSTWGVAFVFGALIVFPAVNRLCNSSYDAAVLRRVLDRIRYLDIGLASSVSGNALFALRLGNVAIGVCTLGLGAPVVRHRCARFVSRAILLAGAVDAERLRRETAPQSREAEGLLEAFDVGFLY